MGQGLSRKVIAEHELYLVNRKAETPIKLEQLEKLAFGVGSLRGLGHISAYNELLLILRPDFQEHEENKEEDEKEIEKIKQDPSYWPPGSLHDMLPIVNGLSGSSAGSIMSLGLIVGMRPHEMQRLFDAKMIHAIFDHFQFSTDKGGRMSFVDVNVLRKELGDVLEERGFSRDITFEELVKARGGKIELAIAAFNVDTNEPELFTSKTAGKNSVVEAVVASSAMETVFKPERMRSTANNQQCANFVDGGEGNELPFRDWHDPEHTLGFYLFDQARKKKLREPFFKSLTDLEKDRIISIEVSPLDSMRFAMTDEMRTHILNNGRNATRTYFGLANLDENKDEFDYI